MQKRQDGKVTRKQRRWLSAFWGKKINTHQRLKFNILFKQSYSSNRQKYCVLINLGRIVSRDRQTNMYPHTNNYFTWKGVKNGTQLPFNAVKATKQNKKFTRRLQCYENKFNYIFSSVTCLLPFVRDNAADNVHCDASCLSIKCFNSDASCLSIKRFNSISCKFWSGWKAVKSPKQWPLCFGQQTKA